MKSWEIFRLNDFCRNKQIKLENVPWIQLDELLRKLGIRINENDKIKERVEDEAKDEVKEIDQEGELSLKETFELPLTWKPIEISSEEVKKDIASNFINIAEYLGFWILNKKDLSKQIETYCTNTKDKDDLARLIVSPNFWHLNKKKTKENYYSIEVRRTWRRFLAKNIDGKFFITGFYKHDMYEKIINNKNKKMLKIRDS